MRFYKYLCIVCLALSLSFCVKRSPEWTEADEALWKQSSNPPSPGVYEQRQFKKEKSEIEALDDVTNNQKKVNLNKIKDITKTDIEKIEVNKELVKEIDVADDITKQEVVPVEKPKPLESLTIMDYPAESYTVQLLASVDYESVIRFAKKQHVSTKFLVTTDRNGKSWYVLLLDVYENYDSAVLARDKVKGEMKNKPWIRKVDSVQKIMKK